MRPKTNNRIAFIFLIIFTFYLAYKLYFSDKVYFLCPISYQDGKIVIRNDSYGSGDFMARRNGSRRHSGIDLQANIGEPVYAVRGGRVLQARFQRGMGNYVEIRNSGGYVTIYGHLSRIDTRQGAHVRQGDKIGEVGRTGNANSPGLAPHLHFEIRLGGTPVDPMDFLSKQEVKNAGD